MGLRLQRLLAPVTALTPGQYTTETVHGGPAVCCPGCGEISDLPETHRILTGGVVSPIWSCPSQRCPFVEFLTLDSWDA